MTQMPIPIAVKNMTVTTANPTASAGWSTKLEKSVSLQFPPWHGISSIPIPEHSSPPFSGFGRIQLLSCFWTHLALHSLHFDQFDQPPSIGHSFAQSRSSRFSPSHSLPPLCGAGASQARVRKARIFAHEFNGHFDQSDQRDQIPSVFTSILAAGDSRLPTMFSAKQT